LKKWLWIARRQASASALPTILNGLLGRRGFASCALSMILNLDWTATLARDRVSSSADGRTAGAALCLWMSLMGVGRSTRTP
jgi:hypothetical protein